MSDIIVHHYRESPYTPYGQGEKLPFAVPATVDMSSWNLVPPFHVE